MFFLFIFLFLFFIENKINAKVLIEKDIFFIVQSDLKRTNYLENNNKDFKLVVAGIAGLVTGLAITANNIYNKNNNSENRNDLNVGIELIANSINLIVGTFEQSRTDIWKINHK